MKNFIVYDKQGKILRPGFCQDGTFRLQAKDGEFIMEDIANGATQKIKFDGFDVDGQPINPRVVDKTPEEIEAEKPPEPKPIPHDKQIAHIANEQWQDVLDRLKKLEKDGSN